MLQTVVTRFSNQSVIVKGWSVTAVLALFALAAKDSKQHFALLPYCSLLMFWLLDAFTLWQERRFRELYEAVASSKQQSTDMSISPPKGSISGWASAAMSVSLVLFYGGLLGLLLVVMYVFPLLSK